MGQSVCSLVVRVRAGGERAGRVVACHAGENEAVSGATSRKERLVQRAHLDVKSEEERIRMERSAREQQFTS